MIIDYFFSKKARNGGGAGGSVICERMLLLGLELDMSTQEANRGDTMLPSMIHSSCRMGYAASFSWLCNGVPLLALAARPQVI